ncbi:MAG: NAD(P)-dependent alcohol dehydrogenase [Myxococcaceae bacterium]|nr:NAD(P)-dependent alcohol dehydrogenase [Myxococcaceae bacterium]
MTTATMQSDVAAMAQTAVSMRALAHRTYGPPEVLRVTEVARPAPAKGEVVLQVRAAGLDRAAWHLVTGRPYLLRLVFGLSAPKNPVAGREVAGVVVAVGEGVTRLRVGDEVFGIGEGTFAELARAKADKLAKKPAALSFEAAAVSGISGLTALDALEAAKVQPGERVLIVGASGGVGSFAVQLARAMGLHVTAVCSGAKAGLVRTLGAEQVIDYSQADFTARAEQFDVILDVGGRTPVAKLRRVLAPSGRLVFVGGEGGDSLSGGMTRQLGTLFLAPFTRQRFVTLLASESHVDLERLAVFLANGSVAPVVERVVGLAQVAEAMNDLARGAVRGKVAVVP